MPAKSSAKAKPTKKKSRRKAAPKRTDARSYGRAIIERVVREFPDRPPASEGERGAQEIFRDELEARGCHCEQLPFRFDTHLYRNLAVHFGVGLAGSAAFAVSPLTAFALHTLAGLSYAGDSSKKFFLLRRLWKFRPSQNLVATLPAVGQPRRRIVLIGHADAAYTGFIFRPEVVRALVGKKEGEHKAGLLSRPLRLATASQFALAGVDLAGFLMGPARHLLWPAVGVLSIPSAIAFGTNMEIWLRSRVVPGANDNLSGCAALPLLAERLAEDKPSDVELVFVAVGCEEAGLGGSWALARQKRGEWDTDNTVVIGLDGLSGGRLSYFDEAEVIHYPLPEWLEGVMQDVSGSETRFADVARHYMGVGHTDAYPFKGVGYDAVTLGCVDPAVGSPAHYHVPDDTPDNLDYDQFALAVDYAEKLVRALINKR